MDALLTTGLKHIDAAYFVAKKLIEAKLAPHKIGMACFTYDRDDAYVYVNRRGKRVTVYANNRGNHTSFALLDIDGIVAKCKEYGFTAGSVTEEQLAKHREAVDKAWNELCQSLSTLKADFEYDDISFLQVNIRGKPREYINLCAENKDVLRIRAQYSGSGGHTFTEPKEAASILQFAYDFPLKEEGEK